MSTIEELQERLQVALKTIKAMEDITSCKTHGRYISVCSDCLTDEIIATKALKLACIEIAQLNISRDGRMVTITDKVMPSYWLELAHI